MIIDLHAHFLPKVDDGSQSTAQSCRMLERSAEHGVEVIVATPHFFPGQDTPEQFLKRREQAAKKIPQDAKYPKILLGAEVAYFPGISQAKSVYDLRIEGTSLLLLELPFDEWSNRMVMEICNIQNSLHLVPVLAHYERYSHIAGSSKAIAQMHHAGCLLQSNAEVFLSSGPSRRKAMRAFEAGEISFLGSDCHNDSRRKPNLGDALQVISSKVGDQALNAFHKSAEQKLFFGNI